MAGIQSCALNQYYVADDVSEEVAICVGECSNRNNKKKLHFDLSTYVITMLLTHFKKHTVLLVKAIPCTELCHILKMQSKKKKKIESRWGSLVSYY